MKCSAHVRERKLGFLSSKSLQCEREMGHPGLHRATKRGPAEGLTAMEFPDSYCFFPHMSISLPSEEQED